MSLTVIEMFNKKKLQLIDLRIARREYWWSSIFMKNWPKFCDNILDMKFHCTHSFIWHICSHRLYTSGSWRRSPYGNIDHRPSIKSIFSSLDHQSSSFRSEKIEEIIEISFNPSSRNVGKQTSLDWKWNIARQSSHYDDRCLAGREPFSFPLPRSMKNMRCSATSHSIVINTFSMRKNVINCSKDILFVDWNSIRKKFLF